LQTGILKLKIADRLSLADLAKKEVQVKFKNFLFFLLKYYDLSTLIIKSQND